MTRRLVPAAATLLLAVACGDPPRQGTFEPSASPQYMYFANSQWSEPVHLPVPVNSPYIEMSAVLSPDGLALYFGSDRPGGAGKVDMWVSRRACTDCAWGEPANLTMLNSPEGDGAPSFSPDGRLMFFTRYRGDAYGDHDIWFTSRADPNDDLGWLAPVHLGETINTDGDESSVSFVPALGGAGNLYFVRDLAVYQVRVGRDGGAAGAVAPVQGLGTPVMGVSVRADGREVVFWANRGPGNADLFASTRSSPQDDWSEPRRLTDLNTSKADHTPNLSHDGRTLVWAAGAGARPSLGATDIWMSTRSPSPRAEP